jgi:choline dehydrogenase
MVNAAGLALPPDNDWNHIANLTGDNSWKSENMRQYFERLESNHFLPKDTPGHGFSGWLGVSVIPLQRVFSSLARATFFLLSQLLSVPLY